MEEAQKVLKGSPGAKAWEFYTTGFLRIGPRVIQLALR